MTKTVAGTADTAKYNRSAAFVVLCLKCWVESNSCVEVVCESHLAIV